MVTICSIWRRASTLSLILSSASDSLGLVLIMEDVSSTVTGELFSDILLIVEASSMSLFSVQLVLVEGNKAVSVNSWLWEFPLPVCMNDRSSNLFSVSVSDDDSVAKGCLIFPIFLITGLIILVKVCLIGLLLWPIGLSLYWASHRNFHPLEVVSRWRDPQLQVSEN